MDILERFKQTQVKPTTHPSLHSGDMVRVHCRVKEGEKTRLQMFEGVVVGVRGSGPSKTVTVRRMAEGFSVERIFPLYSPLIEKIEVTRRQKVRRAKLTYLRQDIKRRRVKENTKASDEASAKSSPESTTQKATANIEQK